MAPASFGDDPFFKLDMDEPTDVNTEDGFTSFLLEDSGSEVNGITIELLGNLDSRRREGPNDLGGFISGEWHNEIYRDFIFAYYPDGIEITLWGLGDGRKCDITIYAFDTSTGETRVANWSTPNESNIIQTWFNGNYSDIFQWPYYKGDKDYYAFSGTATADKYGRIILTSTMDPCSQDSEPFAYVNALIVSPNSTGPGYIPVEEAIVPRPVNGQEDVSVDDVVLSWKAGAYADKHDVYFGTDEAAVTDANRSNSLGVLVSPDHSTTTYTPVLDFNTTYYWRIDEVNDPNIWKGEVWSFTTYVLVLIASNPVPLDGAEGVLADVILSWEKGEYAEKHDVYFGTDEAKVTDANRSNPLGVLVSQDRLTTTYDPPGMLDLDTIYYWRIDEVNSAPDYTIFKGDVWSLSTYVPPLTDLPTWRVDARCFLDGPPGAFDDLAVKDPSIVYSGGKWHLFYTGKDSSMWRMGYASANSISELNSATRHYLNSLNGGDYFCAPQVFWFEPESQWYLIYQSELGATFSTNTDVNDPNGWTAGNAMGITGPGSPLDFWCISDGNDVYCFYSPMNGSHTILRRSTTVEDFPYGWSPADVATTETFEAPHVYKNKADGKYYMMVEGMGATRWQELWTARSPGGMWTKIAEEWAHRDRLVFNADHWTDQVSHGEIIRAGVDERLEIDDIDRCEILIQGVVDGDYGPYGNIPYDLGIIQEYSAGLGDLDLDCDVDFEDFAVLALQWLQPPGVPSADIEPPGGDGIVDVNDLGLLVDSWLRGK